MVSHVYKKKHMIKILVSIVPFKFNLRYYTVGGHGPPPGPGPPVQGPNGMLYFPGMPPPGPHGGPHGPHGQLPMLHLPIGADGSNKPPNRLERLRRWKEKRKNRNFNKTIRYQSRKVCADNRPRIKGKFVKVGSTPDLGALTGGSLGGDEEEEEEDSFDSEGAPPPGSLARTTGLRRDGGLTAAMSVPDLTMMSSMGSGRSM